MVEILLLAIWVTYAAVFILVYLIYKGIRSIKEILSPTLDLTYPHRVSCDDVISTEEFNYLYGLDSSVMESFRQDWLKYLTTVRNTLSFHEYIIRRKREREGLTQKPNE